MNKKAFIYLVFNVPVSMVLFIALLIVNEVLAYRHSNWNPGIVDTLTIVFSTILFLNFITILLLKILNKWVVVLTLLEFVFVCAVCLLFYWST